MDDLDADAADLCGRYQAKGVAAFVIRTTEEGNVRFVLPRLPPKLVAQMLRAAADGYEQQVGPETVN